MHVRYSTGLQTCAFLLVIISCTTPSLSLSLSLSLSAAKALAGLPHALFNLTTSLNAPLYVEPFATNVDVDVPLAILESSVVGSASARSLR